MTTNIIVTAADHSLEQNGIDKDVDYDEQVSHIAALPDGTVSKSKSKGGTRKKGRKTGLLEEDFDDNASVSSSMSSASEHSVKNDTKTKKTKKQHCEVHSRSSKSKVKDVAGDGESGGDAGKEVNASSETDGSGVICTCRKNGKNQTTKKTKVVRPEPEGSLLSDPLKFSFLDDLERVIFSNEPLFSDAEDEDPKLEDQIRAESERFHRRVVDPENIFSAVQMLNTNTMMKLAIIQTELKNVKDVSLRRSEGEIVCAAKRAEVLQSSFEHTENTFKTITNEMKEAVKVIGRLENVEGNMKSGKQQGLLVDAENQRARATSPDAVSKRSSLCRKRLVNAVDLEMAACSLDAAEMKISELEEEQMVISNAKKSRNTSEFEEIIHRLSQCLIQVERQARKEEQAIQYLSKQLLDLNDERLAEKKKHKPLTAELKASFAELSVCLS